MRINLNIFKETIDYAKFDGVIIDEPHVAILESAKVLMEAPKKLDDTTLYVADANLMNSIPALYGVPSIVFLGRPSDIWLKGFANVLYTEDEVSPIELLNSIQDIFTSLNRWTHRLQEVVNEKLPLRELAVRSSQFIQNSIVAQGSGYRFLFGYLPESDTKDEYYIKLQNTLKEFNNTLMPKSFYEVESKTENFKRASHMKEPALYFVTENENQQGRNFQSLYCNAFINGAEVARIYINEILSPIKMSDYVYIKVIAHYLEKALSQKLIQPFTQTRDIDNVLTRLLKREYISEDNITGALGSLGWKRDDAYLCMVISAEHNNSYLVELMTIAIMLSPDADCSTYFMHEGQLVYLYNLTKLKMGEEEFMEVLKKLLETYNLKGGLSSLFTNINDIYYYYDQALYTSRFHINNDSFLYLFENYRLDYMISKSTDDTIVKAMIPESLLRLMEYDKKKGSNLTEVLEAYLSNERNITETVRELYLSRSTFLYQIKKIKQILNIDFDNKDNRIMLLLIFKILKSNHRI